MNTEIINAVTQWLYGQSDFGQACEKYTIVASGDNINITIHRSELEDFKKWFNEIDDQLVIDFCEYVGNDKLKELSDDLEKPNKTSKTIKEVKKYLESTIKDKLDYYTLCQNKFLK